MMTNRIKDQGKRLKAKGSRFFPCTLHLAPCRSHLASPAVQRGFSLISAIFLLVVIAALGTFAVTLSTTQQQSAALDVLGSRAYQAARAGIEWGAFQVIQSGAFATACQPGPTSSVLGTLPSTLSGFGVTVGCRAASAVEGTTTVWVYQVSSVAATQGMTAGNSGYVERQMSVTIAP